MKPRRSASPTKASSGLSPGSSSYESADSATLSISERYSRSSESKFRRICALIWPIKAPLTSSIVSSLSWIAYIVIAAKIAAHRARSTRMPYLSARMRVASRASGAAAGATFFSAFFSLIASHLPGAGA